MAKKKCLHLQASIKTSDGQVWFALQWPPHQEMSIESARCATCLAQLSLGPSNDAPAAVQVEIRAQLVRKDPPKSWECVGWNMHAQGKPEFAPISGEVVAGYLAREMATHNDRETRDADAWPWDPSRPVAGQYEAWEYERQRAADPDCSDEDEDDDTVPRKPGCRCHLEEGDSPCPIHPSPDDDEGEHDPDEPPTDPATKFGERAAQLRVNVNHDDIPIRAGAPEAIGLTPRQLREQTAAGVAAEDEIREQVRAGVEDGGQS